MLLHGRSYLEECTLTSAVGQAQGEEGGKGGGKGTCAAFARAGCIRIVDGGGAASLSILMHPVHLGVGALAFELPFVVTN